MLQEREGNRLDREPLSKKLPRVYTPEAFDKLISETPQMVDALAGFSTVSVSHVLKGTALPEFAVTKWSDGSKDHVNIDLNNQAYLHVYEKQIREDHRFPQGMYNNRAMGTFWTMFERYQEVEPNLPLTHASQLIGHLAGEYLLIETLEKTSATTFGEIVRATEFPDDWNKEHVHSYEDSLYDLYSLGFSGPHTFAEFLKELPKRRGVQILYGPTDQFTDFLDQQELPPDKIDDVGLEVFSSIPNDLVMGIIALGEYEQELLVNK